MKKVDFRRNAPFVIASGACTAWQSISTEKADSMDRHADKSARDDGKKADSRKNKQSNNSKHARRRKDFEVRIVAFLRNIGLRRAVSLVLQGEHGDKPRWLSHKRAEAIHDSSPKANAKRSKL